MKILMIDNYDSFVYNLVQMLARHNEVIVKRNSEIQPEDIETLKPDAIVISPGPGRPSDRPLNATRKIIQQQAGQLPILGVCLGHQTIGHVYHAKITGAKRMMHGKSSPVHHNGEGLFEGLRNPLSAARYHSLVISRQKLPPDLELTAYAEDDNEIMAVRHRKYPTAGVQFHPESIITPQGEKLIRNFLQGRL